MPRINTARADYYGVDDLVCLSWVAEAARDSTDPITFCAPEGERRDILKLMGQEVSEEPKDTDICVYSAYEQERKDRGRKSRLAYITEALGIPHRIKRPIVRHTDQCLEWAEDAKRNVGDNLVMLFPQATSAARAWPACYWVDLAWDLEKNGIPVAVFLSQNEPQYAGTPLYFWGHTPVQQAALMSLSRMVIGVDGGAVHLAGTLGVPTLALCGPTKPDCVFGHLPSVTPLVGEHELNCAGCHWNGRYRQACDQGCRMLHALFPEVVSAEVTSRLGVPRMDCNSRWRLAEAILAAGSYDRPGLLRRALELAPADGLYLEFGVYAGESLGWMNAAMRERGIESPVFGFDSFEGLPTSWGSCPAGYFAVDELPKFDDPRVVLVKGLFSDSLPPFLQSHPGPAAFVHVDCDLYASTKCVLDCLASRIVPGTVILFDELIGYGGFEVHEWRALHEFLAIHPLRLEVIGRAGMQVAMQVVE